MKRTGLMLGLALVAQALVVLAFPSPAHAEERVVFAGWGGTLQDAQRRAIFSAFEKATGIKVVEATQPFASKIKAMVQSGNTEWDVAMVVPVDFLLLREQGLLEKIDYSKIDKETLDGMDTDARDPYGVAAIVYSRVICWNTKAFPNEASAPQSFADVWNVQRFPGKRVFDSGDATFPPIEYALLADGVEASKLYPLDMDRAYKSLTKIRPSVVKWAKTAAIPTQALVDGEATVAVCSHPRIAELKSQGAPVNYTFNQGLLKRDSYVIPKGAKNYANAMKFIAFATSARIEADLSNQQPVSPPNKNAYKYIDATRAKELPTDPSNLPRQLWVNDAWWATTDPASGKSWREQNVVRWNRWVVE